MACEKKKKTQQKKNTPSLPAHPGLYLQRLKTLMFAFWRQFRFKQREGACHPHGLSLWSLISRMLMQVFFPPTCRHLGGGTLMQQISFGSLCCLERKAEPLVTGTVGRVPPLPLSLSTDYRGSCVTSLEQRAHFHKAEARGDVTPSCCMEPH